MNDINIYNRTLNCPCKALFNLLLNNRRLIFQVIHSRRFMRSGTVVGSFKIDLKTVYDAAGLLKSLTTVWILFLNLLLHLLSFIWWVIDEHGSRSRKYFTCENNVWHWKRNIFLLHISDGGWWKSLKVCRIHVHNWNANKLMKFYASYLTAHSHTNLFFTWNIYKLNFHMKDFHASPLSTIENSEKSFVCKHQHLNLHLWLLDILNLLLWVQDWLKILGIWMGDDFSCVRCWQHQTWIKYS